MGKLDKLADQWVADGFYSSRDEAAEAVERVMEQHHIEQRAKEIEAGIRQGFAELKAGKGRSFASAEEQLADAKRRLGLCDR